LPGTSQRRPSPPALLLTFRSTTNFFEKKTQKKNGRLTPKGSQTAKVNFSKYFQTFFSPKKNQKKTGRLTPKREPDGQIKVCQNWKNKSGNTG